jgi:hypothetical protein
MDGSLVEVSRDTLILTIDDISYDIPPETQEERAALDWEGMVTSPA